MVPRLRCCFSDLDKIRKVIKFIKEKDYGLSVTVSGLIRNLDEVNKELGIKPHSINFSLGFHGRTDLLPDSAVLEVVTMCGHGMVGAPLVEHCMNEVKAGRMSPEEAGCELSKPCICGIFNTEKVVERLSKLK